jgi:hypothetical protein
MDAVNDLPLRAACIHGRYDDCHRLIGVENPRYRGHSRFCSGGRNIPFVNEDQVPNWWIEHDAHAILGVKLGTIEAGWRYFCGLVGVAVAAAIGDDEDE